MTPVAGLDGRRVLVVGASAGVGRSVARQAVDAGARVVATARRQDRLDELVAEAGGGIAVAADITDPLGCAELARRCEAELGCLDLVVNATGISLLRPVADTTPDEWARLLTTNVTGCNELIRAALPLLGADGMVVTLSSEAVTRPRSGVGAYAASKAALEATIAAWRHECAPTRFACVAIGATMPTEVADGFEPELLGQVLEDWMVTGTMQTETMATDDVAAALLGMLAAVLPVAGVNIDHVVLRSPAPIVGSWAARRA